MPSTNLIEIVLRAQDEASGVINNLTSGLNGVSQGLINTGTRLTVATAGIAVALGTSINTASEFQTEMANVGAILGNNAEQMREINSQVLDIGRNSVAGPQAAAEAFAEIVGGVADASSHMSILREAIRTAEAGATDLGSTTSALVSTMNAYAFSADQAAFVSDTLTRTVGMGVGSMSEFASALPNVTSVAASVGISFEELAGSMAFITTQGISASVASTQLRAVITALMNPNERMRQALQAMGVTSGTAALQQYGLAETLRLVQEGLGGSQDAMAAALGSVEALTAATILSKDEFGGFIDEFVNGIDGATAAAQAIQLESPAAQMGLLNSQMQALSISVGSALLPAINLLVANARTVLDWIFEWTQANPQLTSTIVGIAAALVALGPILISAGATIAFIISPIGLATMAITGLFLAFQTNLFGIRDLVEPVASRVISGIGQIIQAIEFFVSDVRNFGLREAILGIFGEGNVAETMESSLEGVLVAFGMSRDRAIQIVDSIWERLNKLADQISGLNIGESLQNAFSAIGTIDLSSVANTIVDSIRNLDFTQVQSIFETHFDAIIGFAATAASIIFGGPVGAVIGVARLLLSAIENDFLGIGTFLEESGIRATIEGAFNSLKTTIEGIFSSVFSGQVSLPEVNTFGMNLNELINVALQGVANIGSNILDGLRDLGSGIGDFIRQIGTAETSGLDEIVVAIGGIIGAIANIASQIGGGILSGIGNALGDIGSAIANVISAVSNAGEGDWLGVLTNLSQVMPNLANAFLGFTSGIADGVIEALEDLTGIDLPSVSEGLEALGRGLSTAWQVIQIVFDRVKRGLEIFFLDVQVGILSFIATFRQQVLDATGGQIDIAPDINFNLNPLQRRLQDLRWADAFESAIGASIGEDGIDLSQIIKVGDIEVPISDFLSFDFNVEALAEGLSFTGRQRLEEAIAIAFRTGDFEALDVLLPVATQLEIDVESIRQQAADFLLEGTSQTFEVTTTTDVEVETDITNIADQMATHISDAGASTVFPATSDTTMTVRTPLQAITDQFGSFIRAAALATVYQVQSRADVTVNSGSINTSPLQNAVSSAINLALSAAQSLLNNFRLPQFRAAGGPVIGGSPYIVGERGPELFVPSTSGVIIPNNQLGFREQVINNYNITVPLPDSALQNPERAYSIGQDFARGIMDEYRRSGIG